MLLDRHLTRIVSLIDLSDFISQVLNIYKKILILMKLFTYMNLEIFNLDSKTILKSEIILHL